MEIIDTHGHLNFLAYDEDRQQIIERTGEAGMKVIMPSSQLPTSQQAVKLASQYDFLYAAIGIHPIHLLDEEFKKDSYQKLIDQGGVTAIGETGMDYYHIKKQETPFDELKTGQEKLFRNFISLAQDNKLPLIVHGRFSEQHPKAYQDILRILHDKNVERAVIHCYTGYPDDSKKFVEAGYYLGFTGIITFDRTGNLAEVAKQTPLEQILIETDAPYLSPKPYRGKRNEPLYVIEVARKIAEVKDLSLEKVVEQTTANAKKLFNI